MKQQKKRQYKWLPKTRAMLLGLCLVAGVGGVFAYAQGNGDTTTADARKLQNGGFEEGFTGTGNNQISQNQVPYWNTTAFDGRIEFVKENTNSYISGVTVKPSEGKYAAELNADEESTLYQNVKTTPSSIYEWGLDHGARNNTDTMALVIGPKQSVDPSKPSKDGRDQLMQMIDWLIAQGKTSVKDKAGLGEQLTVYSKKFAANGTFADNAGNNAFSLTPSSIYTEEWHIWIMADSKASSGVNPWGHYGSNAGESAGDKDDSGNVTVDTSKYNLYTVPSGQTETLFGFVSVGVKGTNNKTLGNFLDNINFQLYHPLSASSTAHGSAVIGEDGATSGYEVSSTNRLDTYVTDGEVVKLQAVIKKEDAADGCEFAGVYYTKQDEKGEPVVTFLKASDGWTKSTNDAGDTIYTYSLGGITSATDLHFIFIKSPTVSYDSNGGKPYKVERTYNTEEADNVYSFKPSTDASGSTTFIKPYVSKAAEGQNEGWKFMGWKLIGDTVEGASGGVHTDQLGTLILPAEHTIACDYSTTNASEQAAAQYFKIFDGNVNLSENIQKNNSGETTGTTWANDSASTVYANTHRGLTLVAQWRWLQAFKPQVNSTDGYVDSAVGGTVAITSVTDTESNENYNDTYDENGGKSYFAETNENVTVKATPKEGYTFEGWYDAKGNLITTKDTYSYTETKESVNTYYARFSGSVTQTYIRQVKDGDNWKDIEDDDIATLGRYKYIDAPGNTISSTAKAGSGYKFLGWYDKDGNAVADDMLTNKGVTISYVTKEDATYYARFEKMYTVKFVAQTKQTDGTFKDSKDGGDVSAASVKDVNGTQATSKATGNSGYKFLGWYDKDGQQLSTDATYSPVISAETDGVTYYARFEIANDEQVDSNVLLSFIAESKDTVIPDAFDGRNAGTERNTEDYGLDSKYGNTIATGFKYSIGNMTGVKTIQITVKVPASAYVKVGGTGTFSGNGNAILTDGSGVKYNKGSIQQISGETTLTYYWDASGLKAGETYGFIIDNLYAPGATATVKVNGTEGTQVTNDNGVVNTASGEYKNHSHYAK